MCYEEIVRYINKIPKFTLDNSMNHTQRFMELLNNPEKYLKVIHVAGTNGKGSTCAYLNAILLECQERVGMFTSPHLIDITERIKLNGIDIEQDEFSQIFLVVKQAAEKLHKETKVFPTFYEFLFGMAMHAFVQNNMEYAIIETGLGGRLDATNVIPNPLATVITSIGLDHCQYLGNTIQEIASEKAGIIKKHTPVIYDGTCAQSHEVIHLRAEKQKCVCRKISNDAYEILKTDKNYIDFCIQDAYDIHTTWRINNCGRYQVVNATLAIVTLLTVVPSIWDEEKWKRGIASMQWPGRMEQIEENVYLDGAHNLAAVEAVVRSVQNVDVVIFAAVEDKDYKQMIRALMKMHNVKHFILTQLDNDRAVSVEELQHAFGKQPGKSIYIRSDLQEAWKFAHELQGEGKIICLGSLFLVGMLKKILK